MTVTRADRFTANDKTNQIYSDFLTDLNPHPVSGDIVRFVNENAVIRSIKNLIQTDRGERRYHPTIGSDIRKMLFEPMSSAAAEMISQFIQDTIDKHEPRAKVLYVSVIPNYDKNLYTIQCQIMVINKQEPVSFNVTLQRVR